MTPAAWPSKPRAGNSIQRRSGNPVGNRRVPGASDIGSAAEACLAEHTASKQTVAKDAANATTMGAKEACRIMRGRDRWACNAQNAVSRCKRELLPRDSRCVIARVGAYTDALLKFAEDGSALVTAVLANGSSGQHSRQRGGTPHKKQSKSNF